ncbi:alpha/beta hydrolase [Bermanella marisrubri]|uniref:Predicted hydrolase of the alpha/beta-hydrolase fold protein n=1 Tax=Bermanella marisrubri TaxID=207949 RepID=Q1N687_9GAMM|nr:alpha/beta family hydrolase [Bermanella marisrubri]EAT13705.1 predicted hydrolase of the alpha/beta-hydrolase fold protein [Oceanobacter sp. RED65] [Bermanella marisrubri]QIZ84481.1 alpha/beta hydrolase [Bermanella marisrubri]
MHTLINGPENSPICLFAHGAGAPMDSDFMEAVAQGVGEKGIKVVRFEFPYMQERRETGKKRPPNRQPELLACFKELVDSQQGDVYLMGKSMGGRMASILAAEHSELPIQQVFALGYPFHPLNKPEKLRVDHFPNMSCAMTIYQGQRDKLGDQGLVESLVLPTNIEVAWLEDGDHDLKPRVKSGYTHDEHIQTVINDIAGKIHASYASKNGEQ